jgi:hypothetical protein
MERWLVLVAAGDYALGGSLGAITNDVIIAGAGVDATAVTPRSIHPGFGAYTLAGDYTLALRGTTYAGFGMRDGAVVAVTAGTLEIDDCALIDNAGAGAGGVLFVVGGARPIFRDSVFLDNQSFGGCCGGWGGVVDGEGAATTLEFSGCTATGNRSAWGSFAHITSGTTLTLINSTLTDNVATSAGTLASPGGHYLLINDTIVRNETTTADSAGVYLFSAPAHYEVANSIIAHNTDSTGDEHNCGRRDPAATLTSRGGNLISDSASECARAFTAPGDRLMIDPGVTAGPPIDHGGPTPTLPLTTTSPAHAAGTPDQCPPIDQRGVPRPAQSACDSGAVETP